MTSAHTPNPGEPLHQDLHTASQVRNWLALADHVACRVATQVNVLDTFNRADDVLRLSTFGHEDLREQLPEWQVSCALYDLDHRGIKALTVLAQLEMLANAPDLVAELVIRARDTLRTALLTGVSSD